VSGRATVSVAEIQADLDVGKSTVYRWFETGVIPAVRMGGPGSRWLCLREAYDRWKASLQGEAGAA
jgi:excisionase family DNA binding protein